MSMKGFTNIYAVGEVHSMPSRYGGGSYVVTGHVNCERCKTLIEQREVIEPNRKQRKRGSYYEEYSWCHKCGLYSPNESTKKVLNHA